MSATIHHMEDWTHGDPMQQIDRLELDPELRRDIVTILREIARCRRIEAASAEILRQFHAGHILPKSPAACMAIVELEACRPVGVQ